GQRRARLPGGCAAGRTRDAAAGRPPRRHLVPLPRGQDREAVPPRARAWLYVPARFPGLRLWERARAAGAAAAADPSGPRGARGAQPGSGLGALGGRLRSAHRGGGPAPRADPGLRRQHVLRRRHGRRPLKTRVVNSRLRLLLLLIILTFAALGARAAWIQTV